MSPILRAAADRVDALSWSVRRELTRSHTLGAFEGLDVRLMSYRRGMTTHERWPITFWHHNKLLDQTEGMAPPLRRGDGLIRSFGGYPEESRWRVVDIWVSYDHHGYFDDGVHAFLELVSNTEDDLPQQMAPSYFTL